MVPLKYLSGFWTTLEMPLINFEIGIFLTCSEECIIVTRDYRNEKGKYAISDTKLYAPVFLIKKIKNTVPWTYIISDLKGKETVGMFYKI